MTSQALTDKRDHAAHRAKLRAFFLARPRQEIEADELIQLVGMNYHQRISELRRDTDDPMRLKNLSRYQEDADGTRHRTAGAYLFLDYEPLGRDATIQTPEHRNRTLFDLGTSRGLSKLSVQRVTGFRTDLLTTAEPFL